MFLFVFIDDLKVQLSRYLLKTMCTDMTNEMTKYLAQDYKITIPSEGGTEINKVSTF